MIPSQAECYLTCQRVYAIIGLGFLVQWGGMAVVCFWLAYKKWRGR